MRHLWPFGRIYKSIEAAFFELNAYYAPFIAAKLKQRRKIRFSQKEDSKSEAELTAEEEDFLDSFMNAVDQYGSAQQEPASDELR